MNSQHLKLFTRIATILNISKAGQELGLSPAVASAHISKLEQSLGVRLLHRSTRKISLTDEGKIFLPHAQDLLDKIEEAKNSIDSSNTEPTGIIRITAPASFGRQHLLQAIATFMQIYPKIQIDLNLTDVIVDVIEGGFDIAIRNDSLQDSSLIARKLTRDKRIICAAPSYLEKYGIPNTIDDLKDHCFVSLKGSETWHFKDKHNDLNAISIKTHSRLITDNGEVMREACLLGIGLSINSTWNCYKHIEAGTLIQVLSEYPLAHSGAIWAVFPTKRLIAPKVRLLIDFLTDWFDETPYWDKALEK